MARTERERTPRRLYEGGAGRTARCVRSRRDGAASRRTRDERGRGCVGRGKRRTLLRQMRKTEWVLTASSLCDSARPAADLPTALWSAPRGTRTIRASRWRHVNAESGPGGPVFAVRPGTAITKPMAVNGSGVAVRCLRDWAGCADAGRRALGDPGGRSVPGPVLAWRYPARSCSRAEALCRPPGSMAELRADHTADRPNSFAGRAAGGRTGRLRPSRSRPGSILPRRR